LPIFRRPKTLARKDSDNRRNLRILTLEGLPAIVILTLLGGQFLTGYLLYLGASSSQIGLVLAIPTLANVAQIVFAAYSNRFNRKVSFATLASLHRLCWAATGLIPFLFPREWWMAVYIPLYSLAFLANATSSMMWTSLVGDMVPARVRAQYMGLRNTLINAVGTLVLFVGAQILDRYPGAPGFHILFIIIGIFMVLNISAFWLYPNLPAEPSEETKFLPMLKRPIRDKSFMRPAIFLSAWTFIQAIAVPLFSYVMLKTIHLGQGKVSIMTITQTLAMVASFYLWGKLNARYGNKKLLFWTLPLIAASCLSWGLLSFLPVLPILFIAHILLGVGVGGYNQLVFNFVIGDTPKSERMMFIAVFNAVTGISGFFGPIVGGWIYQLLELSPSWLQIYGLNVAIGVILLTLTLTLGRRALQ